MEQQRTTNPEFRSNLLTKIEQLRLAPNSVISLAAELALTRQISRGGIILGRKQHWLTDGSGYLEVLADEHVVRPTDLDHVDGV
jgi:hypothetical protein